MKDYPYVGCRYIDGKCPYCGETHNAGWPRHLWMPFWKMLITIMAGGIASLLHLDWPHYALVGLIMALAYLRGSLDQIETKDERHEIVKLLSRIKP